MSTLIARTFVDRSTPTCFPQSFQFDVFFQLDDNIAGKDVLTKGLVAYLSADKLPSSTDVPTK